MAHVGTCLSKGHKDPVKAIPGYTRKLPDTCPACGKTNLGKNKRGHITKCFATVEKYGNPPVCRCGKTFADFNNKLQSFVRHANFCKSEPKTNERLKTDIIRLIKKLKIKGKEYNKKADEFKKSNLSGPALNMVMLGWLESLDKSGKRDGDPLNRGVKFACEDCGKSFDKAASLRSHRWIHAPKENEWGDKDEVRKALQDLAAPYLRRIPKEKRVAICLPGNRPEHELELLSNPGFAKVFMAEIDETKCKETHKDGYDVLNVDFVDLLARLTDEGAHLALIDFDICGIVTYADGSQLLDTIRRGGIADVACIRLTSCRRSYRRSGQYDVEAIEKDLPSVVPSGYQIVSKASSIYVGKDHSSMMVSQWIIRKEG